MNLPRLVAAECLGTALLVATVVGSGIMAQALSAPADAPAFIAAQLAGALAALGMCHRVFG